MANKATVKLTADQSEMAAALGMSENDFAEWSATVEKENEQAAKAAADAADKAAKEWAESCKKMRENINIVGEWALKVGGTLLGLGGAAVYASEKQTEATNKLNRAVENAGSVTGYTNEQLAQMAERMGDVAGVSDQVVTGAQTIIARFDNIRGDNFKKATELALDMGRVLGDVGNASEKLGEMLQSPIEGISLLEGEGVAFTTAQKEMIAEMVKAGDVAGAQGIILEEVSRKFGGAAADFGGSYSGQLGKFTDRLVDIGERAGKVLLPFLEQLTPLVENTIGLLEVFAGSWEDTGETMNTVATDNQAIMGEWFDYVAGGLMTMYNMAKFVFDNFGDLLSYVGKQTKLTFLGMVEDSKHLFGVVLPEFLQWLQRNWPEVLTDISNITKTVFQNMVENAKNFGKALFNILKGEEFDFEFTGLTEGFKSSLKELPNIAKRELTAQETELGGQIDKLGEELGDKWNKAVLAADKAVQQAQTNAQRTAADEGGPDMAAVGSKPYKQLGLESEKKDEEIKIERAKREKAEKAAEEKEETGSGSKAGSFEGLEALRARIAGATGSPEDKRHNEQIKQLEKLVKAAEETAQQLKDQTPEERIETAINNQLLAIEDLEKALMGGDNAAAGPLQEAIEGLGMLKEQQEHVKKQRESIQVLRDAIAKGDVGKQVQLNEVLANFGKAVNMIPQAMTDAQQATLAKANAATRNARPQDMEERQLLRKLAESQKEILAEAKLQTEAQRQTKDNTKIVADRMPSLGLQ